jgi:hypothetical protein
MIASHSRRVVPLNSDYTLTETLMAIYFTKSRPGLYFNVSIFSLIASYSIVARSVTATTPITWELRTLPRDSAG